MPSDRVTITRESFDSFIEELPLGFRSFVSDRNYELVYETDFPVHPLSLRIRSSIDASTGKTHDNHGGIKTFTVHTPSGIAVSRQSDTYRLPSWQENLRPKIYDAFYLHDTFSTCLDCGNLVLADGCAHPELEQHLSCSPEDGCKQTTV